MITIGSYLVPAKDYRFNKQVLRLEPAEAYDMPKTWDFGWEGIWNQTNFNFQGIIKLVLSLETVGLIRYSVCPDIDCPTYIYIDQLEAIPSSRGLSKARLIQPIGKWLIWYVGKVALRICNTKAEQPLITLHAYEEARDYYEEKIGMQFHGIETIAPGEDGYFFSFSRQEVMDFCLRVEEKYGTIMKLR